MLISFKGLFKSKSGRHDTDGQEVLDSTPIALPVGFKRPETLAEQVARLVRSESFNSQMRSQGRESFDEANDFDFDDEDPLTPYEADPELATVQAANRGFIEERPISVERKDELLSRYRRKKVDSSSDHSQIRDDDRPKARSIPPKAEVV